MPGSKRGFALELAAIAIAGFVLRIVFVVFSRSSTYRSARRLGLLQPRREPPRRRPRVHRPLHAPGDPPGRRAPAALHALARDPVAGLARTRGDADGPHGVVLRARRRHDRPLRSGRTGDRGTCGSGLVAAGSRGDLPEHLGARRDVALGDRGALHDRRRHPGGVPVPARAERVAGGWLGLWCGLAGLAAPGARARPPARARAAGPVPAGGRMEAATPLAGRRRPSRPRSASPPGSDTT